MYDRPQLSWGVSWLEILNRATRRMRATLDLLRAVDRGADPEHPDGFDWWSADEQFRALATAVGEALGAPLEDIEGPESIQDAMFHGQANVPASVLRVEPGTFVTVTASNFGRLIAVRPEVAVHPAALTTMQRVFDAHGYVYVDATLQDTPYDGRTPLDTRTPTWWKRYFEYSAVAS